MAFFKSMDISASALTANRYWMDIIGENIANASTTRTAAGGTYRRKYVVMQERPFSAMLDDFSDSPLGEETNNDNVESGLIGEEEGVPFINENILDSDEDDTTDLNKDFKDLVDSVIK